MVPLAPSFSEGQVVGGSVISPLAVRAKCSTGSIGSVGSGACVIPLVHVRICTCPLKLLHGVTDSICSVRAAFSTGFKWGPH